VNDSKGARVATFTIRNVPEEVRRAWGIKAAESGCSLAEALRQLVFEHVREGNEPASRIDAEEILRRATDLASDPPLDDRYKYFTQKELSDAISGVHEGL
jgi:plasmid stability protein